MNGHPNKIFENSPASWQIVGVAFKLMYSSYIIAEDKMHSTFRP